MEQFKKILVGVDLDHQGFESTISQAAGIAACAGAEVEVAYVCPDYVSNAFLEAYLDQSVLEQAASSYQERLNELCQKVMPANVPWRIELGRRKGHNAYQYLTSRAKEENFDLIIIGEHDRHGFDHIWLGSNAEKVVRYAPCTVMVIKHKT
ncbi:MAG: universal stress protein [bacterium]|nr:universal stress protein [bacterium]